MDYRRIGYQLGVVAHVERQYQIDNLSADLEPEVIEVDDGSRGVGGNHIDTLKALRRKDPDTWLVVMEDDAQPVPYFHEQVADALRVAPTPIVSFYCGSGYPAQYQALFTEAIQTHEEACWLLHPQLRHGVCYAIHPMISRAVIIRMEKLITQQYAPDDAITKWALENRTEVAYSNPSLVNHEDGPTVIDYRMHLGHVGAAGRKRPRKAHRVGTRLTWNDNSVAVRP